MSKRNRIEDEEYIKKKIRRLEKKLRKIPKENQPTEPTSSSRPSPEARRSPPHGSGSSQPSARQSNVPPEPEQECEQDDELPEEFLEALGCEGQVTTEVGENIRSELKLRWFNIMCNGLGKEAKETITKKYPTPENFPNCKAPIMNPEILAAISELSQKRDKRIIARQNLTAKVITCLGKSLTNILKGNLMTKTLIEEISDAAKMAAEIFYEDSSSRRFFALAGANPIVKEAIRESKPDKHLFGEDCAEKIKAAQSIKKTGTQIKPAEGKPTVKGPSQSSTKKQGNWKGPPQYHQHQRGRGGHRSQPLRKSHQNLNPVHQRDQRRNQYKPRPNYRKY